MIALLGLGCNLGDRARSLRDAFRLLGESAGGADLSISHLYETRPWGMADQPPFLNAVAVLDTPLAPRDLASRLWEIESRLGRTREGPRFGPRVIDLDLLDAGGAILDEPDLVLPHPRIAERAFVLVPLCEIRPRWVHPRDGRTAAQMLAALDPDPADVRLAGRLASREENPRGSAGPIVPGH